MSQQQESLLTQQGFNLDEIVIKHKPKKVFGRIHEIHEYEEWIEVVRIGGDKDGEKERIPRERYSEFFIDPRCMMIRFFKEQIDLLEQELMD